MAFIPPVLFPRVVDRKDDPRWINLTTSTDAETELAALETEHKEFIINLVKQYNDIIPVGKSQNSEKEDDDDDEEIEEDDEFESADADDLEEIDANDLYVEEAELGDSDRSDRQL